MVKKKIGWRKSNKMDLNLLSGEIQVSVSFTAFMTAVSIFFVGLLITSFKTYNLSIKVPILFLIISTFGFLYATLIYSNASVDLSKLKTKKFYKNMLVGDTISEYLGVYFLVLAIPLVINVITTDTFLRLSTLIVALGGLIIYHKSGFSMMGKHFKKGHNIYLFLIVFLEIALFLSQIYYIKYFVSLAVILILIILLLAYYASRGKSV